MVEPAEAPALDPGTGGEEEAQDLFALGREIIAGPEEAWAQEPRMLRVCSEIESEDALADEDPKEGFHVRRRTASSTSSITVNPGLIGWSEVTNTPLGEVLFSGWQSHDHQLQKRRRRTKIVCAIGPASREVETLLELLAAGMNIARLNFSHGDHAYHLQTLQNIREAEQIRRKQGFECHCAILMDTKGPEIRTGLLKDHEPVQLQTDQLLEICTDYTFHGDSTKIACSYEHLCDSAEIGGTILIADGSISCVVEAIKDSSVIVRVQNNAILQERKNMNIPGVSIRMEGITEKDRHDIEEFALKYDVDIVSGSFIRTAANVRSLRACLGPKGNKIRVHAKIESVEGLRNIHEIIAEADGVHVSRGDLGMELPLAKLFLAQKAIIRWANLAGKPVITSTQMLDSMTKFPRPTNAECSDVANAVLDGTDCAMLSAETASGLYPKESVETMARIIAEAELALDYDSHFSTIRDEVLSHGNVSVLEALASSAVENSIDTDAPVIVLLSETGVLPMLVAKYRPPARILVVTNNVQTARQMSASRGVSALMLKSHSSILRPSTVWLTTGQYLLRQEWARSGDRITMVASPLDGDLNQAFDEVNDYRNSRRLVNCVEIRVLDEAAIRTGIEAQVAHAGLSRDLISTQNKWTERINKRMSL